MYGPAQDVMVLEVVTEMLPPFLHRVQGTVTSLYLVPGLSKEEGSKMEEKY